MRRCFPFLLAFISVACTKSVAPYALSQDAQRASAFIDELKKGGPLPRVHTKDSIKSEVAAKKLDEKALLRGTLEMLQSAEPKEKKKAIWFLGRLGDPSAIGPLVKAIDKSDVDSREDICLALQWLDAMGEPAESALVKLRREDPSADVRVAAAIALARPKDPEARAAYELGLRSTKKAWVRELCEDELEKQGKLQLPLSPDVYEEVNGVEYEKLKNTMRNTLRREIRVGNTFYFEVLQQNPDAVPAFNYWYKMKVEPDKIQKHEVKKPSKDLG